jgi:hypothetical protein
MKTGVREDRRPRRRIEQQTIDRHSGYDTCQEDGEHHDDRK